MSTDAMERALAELGKLIGIPDLTFGGDGISHLKGDKQQQLAIKRDDRNYRLVVVGLVALALPEWLDRAVIEELLALGLSPLRDDGAGVGLDSSSGAIVLHQSFRLDQNDAEQLRDGLVQFIGLQTHWSERLSFATMDTLT
ncbi:CesT family type III secretion system chaperone [Paraburkholderia sediminicola]|uniref:CesT family type III secretion system chaperone n=1 Tax=Paraburkholderia sediminicola TaxID=458836 RepID=UPI0038BA3361